MSSTPDFATRTFRPKVDVELDRNGFRLTLPRPILDINTKTRTVFNRIQLPIVSREASEILFREESFEFSTQLLALAFSEEEFVSQTVQEIGKVTIPEARSRIALDDRIEEVAPSGDGGGPSADAAFILNTVFGTERDFGEEGEETLADVVSTDIEQQTLTEARSIDAFRQRVLAIVDIPSGGGGGGDGPSDEEIRELIEDEVEDALDAVIIQLTFLREDVSDLEDRVDRIEDGLRDRILKLLAVVLPAAFLSTPRAYVYQALVSYLRSHIDRPRARDIREITNGFVVFLVDDDTRENLSAEADKARS